MTAFSGACSVTSCRFNLGGGRVSCDWLRGGRGRCHHHAYREAWTAGHELEQAQEAEMAPILAAAPAVEMHDLPARPSSKMQEPLTRPLSMTSRATAASKPMDAARARQMLLDLGEV